MLIKRTRWPIFALTCWTKVRFRARVLRRQMLVLVQLKSLIFEERLTQISAWCFFLRLHLRKACGDGAGGLAFPLADSLQGRNSLTKSPIDIWSNDSLYKNLFNMRKPLKDLAGSIGSVSCAYRNCAHVCRWISSSWLSVSWIMKRFHSSAMKLKCVQREDALALADWHCTMTCCRLFNPLTTGWLCNVSQIIRVEIIFYFFIHLLNSRYECCIV